ncbi:MAG TPA: endonuclease/exonuclease/phosphatase family protein, partial [Phnomibacter sp.]|nr:endonuclease/exonuclease/phosphatase family protein [Phnomibacter sp.]
EIGILRTVEVIKQAGPDIVALQETYGSGAIIADMLGYSFYLRSSNLSIMSRYPIASTGPAIHPFYHGSAYIDIPHHGPLLFSNVWLNYPFDYWEDLYHDKKPDSARWVHAMRQKNADTMKAVLQRILPEQNKTGTLPMIIAGDFNSGSHLDWTERNRPFNKGYAIPFPTTVLLMENDFLDSYRMVHPNETTERGLTWSPYIKTNHQDRIDNIYYKSDKLQPIGSNTTLETSACYPSDHRGVITQFKWKQ